MEVLGESGEDAGGCFFTAPKREISGGHGDGWLGELEPLQKDPEQVADESEDVLWPTAGQ